MMARDFLKNDFVIILQAKTVHRGREGGGGWYTQLQLQLINLVLKVFNTGGLIDVAR